MLLFSFFYLPFFMAVCLLHAKNEAEKANTTGRQAQLEWRVLRIFYFYFYISRDPIGEFFCLDMHNYPFKSVLCPSSNIHLCFCVCVCVGAIKGGLQGFLYIEYKGEIYHSLLPSGGCAANSRDKGSLFSQETQ